MAVTTRTRICNQCSRFFDKLALERVQVGKGKPLFLCSSCLKKRMNEEETEKKQQ